MRAKRFPKLEMPKSYDKFIESGGSVAIESAADPIQEACLECGTCNNGNVFEAHVLSSSRDGAENGESASVLMNAGCERADNAEDHSQDLTRDQKLDMLITKVTSQNALREALYKTLKFCTLRRDFNEVEEFIASTDEYAHSHIIQTPYTLINMLQRAYGLDITPYNSQKEVLDDLDSSGMQALCASNADEVCGFYVETTDIGEAALQILSPQIRIQSELNKKPYRKDTFLAVMEFCKEPRTLPDIQQMFDETPGLSVDVVAQHHHLSPDFYVDRLDKAGALVWRGSWNLTEEGLDFLNSAERGGGIKRFE